MPFFSLVASLEVVQSVSHVTVVADGEKDQFLFQIPHQELSSDQACQV